MAHRKSAMNMVAPENGFVMAHRKSATNMAALKEVL